MFFDFVRFALLYVFSGLLGLLGMAVCALALHRYGIVGRVCDAVRTLRTRAGFVAWMCVVPLVCALVVRGSTKTGGGPNSPPPRMNASRPGMTLPLTAPHVVTDDEIDRGYRDGETHSSDGTTVLRDLYGDESCAE